jgi:hypothetical protein
MIRSVTALSRFASAGTLALLALAAPVAAQNAPMRDRDPTVRDIATTPIRDLNLSRDEIPAALQQAAVATYVTDGLTGCAQIGAAIAELDEILGPDFDISQAERDNISVGRMARSAVASLIPFRGIVRELTGAADHQRQFEEAIFAGAVRRGFLKGLGQQRGCAYPARPAFANVQVTAADTRTGTVATNAATSETRAADGTVFVNQPVVQGE